MASDFGQFAMSDVKNQTEKDVAYARGMDAYFAGSLGGNLDKLRNFTKFVSRQSLSLFLAKNELFQNVLGIHGSIVECGVFLGGGLMTWAQLSAIYEPYNHVRKVIGFDTFTGFPGLSQTDLASDNAESLNYFKEGGLCANAFDDISRAVELYDINRPIGHIEKLQLQVGDATLTIPSFLEQNKHTVVSLLYLDFDLYEPTKVAIECFLPRMPKGAIIAFDELNQKSWPGETMAVLETVGLRNLRIERFPHTPQLSYAVLD